jgi:hypothetical protein
VVVLCQLSLLQGSRFDARLERWLVAQAALLASLGRFCVRFGSYYGEQFVDEDAHSKELLSSEYIGERLHCLWQLLAQLWTVCADDTPNDLALKRCALAVLRCSPRTRPCVMFSRVSGDDVITHTTLGVWVSWWRAASSFRRRRDC